MSNLYQESTTEEGEQLIIICQPLIWDRYVFFGNIYIRGYENETFNCIKFMQYFTWFS